MNSNTTISCCLKRILFCISTILLTISLIAGEREALWSKKNMPHSQGHQIAAMTSEVQQKIRAVDGIKSEVDRQRRYGHQTLVIALAAGLVLGGIVATLAYLYPINPELLGESGLAKLKVLIDPWKHYILLFVTICAISLGVIFSSRKGNVVTR